MTLEKLACLTGSDTDLIKNLVACGGSAGPTYVRTAEGWWSAVEASLGQHSSQPPVDGERWYNASAAWWLRRAAVFVQGGFTIEAAARANGLEFERQFAMALDREPLAILAYPECFRDGRLNPERSRAAAQSEWESYKNGAYGGCLLTFTGQSCVEKESLKAKMIEMLSTSQHLSGDALIDALALAHRLSGLMLPFPPSERGHCTPGRTIDALLERAGLGREEPYLLH